MIVSDEYAAGLFDGEGCISLAKNRAYGYTLQVTVVNTNMECLAAMKETYGGYVAKPRPHEKHPHWKPRGHWQISSNMALRFLLRIRPFLIVKCKQADDGIAFQRIKRERSIRFSSGGPRMNETERAYEDYYKSRMTTLNMKGVVPLGIN